MMVNKRTIIILHDLLMAAIAWELAWLARFNFEFPYPYLHTSLYTVPLVVAIQGAVFAWFRLYRGMWRFASIPDLWNILRSAALGALCTMLACFIMFRLQHIPRSILILYPVFLIFCLGGPRLTYRFWKDRSVSLASVSAARRVLVIGAGRAAEMVVREMLRERKYLPVGFVDDRPELKNAEIHGIRVLGSLDDLNDICQRLNPDILAIAIPSASTEQMQRIVQLCEDTGVPMRTLPGINELVTGGTILNELRSVSIEDLLGREKVELDWHTIQSGLAGKAVLVTGGGGSIGAELCRQIARLAPAKLIILERSEFNLYRIHRDLVEAHPLLPLVPVLTDVGDRTVMDRVFAENRPQVVFHAAAYKHVPILQQHVREAVVNNVFGTVAAADAAVKAGCEKFVLISTDKAVNPANVLGASKRVAELVCESRNSGVGTRFITVRFGNVLGSDGSAIPLFREQVERGGPVTVTHPEVTRYFMTKREACQLILQTGAMGEAGAVYVLDMGKPMKILYLAEQMVKLSGLQPGRDIEIRFTGLRPGEKMSEDLFYPFEVREATAHRKIFLARHPEINVEYLEAGLGRLHSACDICDDAALNELLNEMTGTAALYGVASGKVVPLTPGRLQS